LSSHVQCPEVARVTGPAYTDGSPTAVRCYQVSTIARPGSEDARTSWPRTCLTPVARITPARPRAASSDALPAALPASDAIGTRDSVSDKPRVTIGQVEREAHARRGPNPDRGVIPKRGYVTQRSGVPPFAKIKFCRVFGEGT